MKKLMSSFVSLLVVAGFAFAGTETDNKVFTGKIDFKQRVDFGKTSVVNVDQGATMSVNTGATFSIDAGSTFNLKGTEVTKSAAALNKAISWWSTTNMLVQAGAATNGQAVTFATSYASTITPFVFLSWRDTCIAAATGDTYNVSLNAASVASNGFSVASGVPIAGLATNVQYLVIGPMP